MINLELPSVLASENEQAPCESAACELFTEKLLAAWRNGDTADANRAIQNHSILRRHQSLAVDLAYEEFCLRVARGEIIDTTAYCNKFPEIRHALERQIEFHKLMEDNPNVLSGLTETNWPETEAMFLGFRLRKEIGRGAFARVYLANEIALGNRDVVVKVSDAGCAEANTLGKLSHPNIIPVHSVFADSTSNLTAMCMPSLGKLTLQDIVRLEGRLDSRMKLELLSTIQKQRRLKLDPEWIDSEYTRAVLDVGVKLANALSFAHAAGVLHLDLKPSNILITVDGEPMLLDFNLSRDVNQESLRIGGTLPYMSPEQLVAFVDKKYDFGPVTVLSDVYGFGVILFQLLRGELPFPLLTGISGSLNESAQSQIVMRQTGPPEWRNPELWIPYSIRKLISDCLEFDPSLRPQSMKEVLERLQRQSSLPSRIVNWLFIQRRVIAVAAILSLGIPFLVDERPAYSTRLVSRAIFSYKNRQFDRAIDQTSKVLMSNEADPNALILQSLAFVQKRDYIRAMQTFKEARPFISDARIMAVAAHCFATSKHHDDAIGWYSDAIRAGLEGNANVHNNIGFSLMQRGRLDEAIQHFNKALDVSPNHTAALHNCALADLKMAARNGQYSPNPVILIEQAIARSESSWELERDAAWIYAWAETEHTRESGGAVILHLRRSLQMGIQTRMIVEDPMFAPYVHNLKFEDRDLSSDDLGDDVRPARRVHDHRDLLIQIQVDDFNRKLATK